MASTLPDTGVLVELHRDFTWGRGARQQWRNRRQWRRFSQGGAARGTAAWRASMLPGTRCGTGASTSCSPRTQSDPNGFVWATSPTSPEQLPEGPAHELVPAGRGGAVGAVVLGRRWRLRRAGTVGTRHVATDRPTDHRDGDPPARQPHVATQRPSMPIAPRSSGRPAATRGRCPSSRRSTSRTDSRGDHSACSRDPGARWCWPLASLPVPPPDGP